MQAATVIQMIYGFPSFLFLCFAFCLPFAYRKSLGNPFYRLLQIDILVNITCYINTWLSIRLETFEFGVKLLVYLEYSVPGILTVSKFFIAVYFHMQNVTGLSLVVYRFSSVYSLNSERYWNRWWPLVPIVGILYTFLILSPWWFGGRLITRVIVVNGFIQKRMNERALFTHATFNPCFAVFYFLLYLLLGVWTTVKLEEKGRKSNSNRHRHFVKKLTRVILCNSFLMSGNLLLVIAMSIGLFIYFPLFLVRIQMVVVTFTSDMVTLAMPYILLAFDSNIRRIVKLEKQFPYSKSIPSCTGRTITNYAMSS